MSLIKLKQLVATQSREIGTPSDGNYQDGLLPFVPTTLIADAFDAINVALTGSVLWVNSGSYIARTSDVQITGSLNVSNSGSFNYLQISGSTIETSNIISFGTASLYRVNASDLVTFGNGLIVTGSTIVNSITASGDIQANSIYVGSYNTSSDENVLSRISVYGTGYTSLLLEDYTLSQFYGNRIDFKRRWGAPESPAPIGVSNAQLGNLRFYGYTSADVYGASIVVSITGSYDSSSLVVPSFFMFNTAAPGGFSFSPALRIDENQMTTAYKGLYSWRLSFMSSSTGRYVDTISNDISLSGSSKNTLPTEYAIKNYVTGLSYWTGSSGYINRQGSVKVTSGNLTVENSTEAKLELINTISSISSSFVLTEDMLIGYFDGNLFLTAESGFVSLGQYNFSGGLNFVLQNNNSRFQFRSGSTDTKTYIDVSNPNFAKLGISGEVSGSSARFANISASKAIYSPLLNLGFDSSSSQNDALKISTMGLSPVGIRFNNYSYANNSGPSIYMYRRHGIPSSPGNLSSSISYILGDFRFYGRVSGLDSISAQILVSSTGSYGTFSVPSKIEFYTADTVVPRIAMKIDQNQLVTTYNGLHTNTLSFINSTTGKQANRFSTDTTLSGSSNTTLVSENAVKVYVDTVSSSIASTIVSLNSGSWYGLNGGEIRRSSNIQITGSSPVKIKQTTTDDETPAISIFKTGNGAEMWPVIEFNAADDDFFGGYATLNGNEGLGKLKFKGHNGTTFIPSIEIYGLLAQDFSVTPGTNTTAGELQFRVVRYNEDSLSNLLLLNTNLTSSYGLQVSKFGLGDNKRKVTLISTDTTLSGSSNSSIVTENVVKSYVQFISSSFASTIDGGTF